VLIPDVILEIQFDTPLKVSGALCAIVRLSGANPTKFHSRKRQYLFGSMLLQLIVPDQPLKVLYMPYDN
jgi:hypothetical protein